MEWLDYFKPPFHIDIVCDDTVWSSIGQRVLVGRPDCEYPKELMLAILNVLNSSEKVNMDSKCVFQYLGTNTSSNILCYYKGKTYLWNVRGWGYLISKGKLDNNEAVSYQDLFGSTLIDKLNQLYNI